jgi:hypothetical protein
MVPLGLTEEVMRSAHDNLLGGHLGKKRTLNQIQIHYWWPGMYSQVWKWVQTCPMCQQQNNPKGRTPGQLQPIPATRPFERVGINLSRPLPKSMSGNQHLLVMVNYLMKWPEVVALPNMKAETVVKVFGGFFPSRGQGPECQNHTETATPSLALWIGYENSKTPREATSTCLSGRGPTATRGAPDGMPVVH